LQHLLRRLGEPAFVAVGRRQREQARQPQRQAQQNQRETRSYIDETGKTPRKGH